MFRKEQSNFISKLLKSLLFVAVLFTLSFFLPASAQDATSTQEVTSNAPTVVYQGWFPGLSIDGTFTDVVVVRDFPTGTGTGLHSHGGPGLILTIDGTFTTEEESADTNYGAGKGFTETPGHIHEGFNDQSATARIISSYLLTEGAKVVIPEGESTRPAATKLFEAQFPDITMDGMFAELMRVVDFAPGATTGLHVHNGPTFLLVIDGALTLRQDGGETVYEAGQSWMEMPDHIHEAINTGETTARLIAIYLLPMAEPATTVEQ